MNVLRKTQTKVTVQVRTPPLFFLRVFSHLAGALVVGREPSLAVHLGAGATQVVHIANQLFFERFIPVLGFLEASQTVVEVSMLL